MWCIALRAERFLAKESVTDPVESFGNCLDACLYAFAWHFMTFALRLRCICFKERAALSANEVLEQAGEHQGNMADLERLSNQGFERT